jgi:hypothetical protein
MVFQFKFPTPNYVKTPEPHHYSKAEYTRVYSFCPADEVMMETMTIKRLNK